MLANFIKHAKLPLVIIVLLFVTILAGLYMPLIAKQAIYTVSLLAKEIIICLLPLVVFALIFTSITRLGQGAVKLVLLLVPMLCISNFISSWVGYSAGSLLISKLSFHKIIAQHEQLLMPLININLPKIISSKYAMLLALVGGYISSIFMPTIARTSSEVLAKVSNVILHKIFIPLIPLLICGFVLKMQYEGLLGLLLKNYAIIFVSISLIQLSYIFLLYLIANSFNLAKAIACIKNMLPAIITGMSTQSSAAALPASLHGVEANINNPRISNFVVPSSVNFHLIGDCIAIPIFALAIMSSFGLPPVHPLTFLSFSLYVVIAKFGVAAVPGGGIIVIWPILEGVFGFNAGMLSFIQALYIFFDSFITAANVLGNGAFAMIYNNVYKGLKLNVRKS
jgi:Na+/H+-dicarboxylate symporter